VALEGKQLPTNQGRLGIDGVGDESFLGDSWRKFLCEELGKGRKKETGAKK